MLVHVLKSAALAAALFGLASGAGAATIFNFSFTAPWSFIQGGGTATGSGQLTANDNGNGSYTVTGVTGTSKLTASSPSVTLDSVSAPLFGTPTINFSVANGYSFTGILSGGSTSYNFSKNLFDSNYTISSGVRTTSGATFALAAAVVPAAVPETATWMMMIIGFGGIGLLLRSGKRTTPRQMGAL